MEFSYEPERTEAVEPSAEKEPDPLTVLDALAEEFEQLEHEADAPGGARERRMMHLQRSYREAIFYHSNPDKYPEFQRHAYFSGLRQKPNVRNIMFSVLKFTMRAKGNEKRLNRLSKCAPVLEFLRTQGVSPDSLASHLEAEGGVDCIYERLCDAKKLQRKKMPAEELRSDLNNAECAKIDAGLDIDATDEPSAIGGQPHHDAFAADDDGRDVSPATDDVERKLADRPDDKIDPLSLPRRRRLNMRDLDTELIVELGPAVLPRALVPGWGIMRFTTQPADRRGWLRVIGEILEFHQGEDQPPESANDNGN